MKKLLPILTLLITTVACNNSSEKETSKNGAETNQIEQISADVEYAKSIEEAHNKSQWEDKKAISFDILLKMGDNERLNATITSLTNSTAIRLDKNNGSSLVYNGKDIFLSPEDADEERARFDIFTWQYFAFLPFKLTDPGTNWELLEPTNIKGKTFNRGKLSFDNEIGDSPDDWYVIYQEPDSGLLYAAAYIVTFGTAREEAEKNPHAIVYHDYQTFEGVPLSTRWTFHNWSEENGIEDQIGEAVLSNFNFVQPEKTLFEEPENAIKIEK